MELIKISVSKFSPDIREISLLCELSGSGEVLDVVYEDFNCFYRVIVLFVDDKGFFVKLVLFPKGDFGDLEPIIIV